jgi:hypothetical protein
VREATSSMRGPVGWGRVGELEDGMGREEVSLSPGAGPSPSRDEADVAEDVVGDAGEGTTSMAMPSRVERAEGRDGREGGREGGRVRERRQRMRRAAGMPRA